METETITRATMEAERARYMRREISFADYYCWIADRIGVTERMLPAPIARIRQALATDEHLNNIALERWDAKHSILLPLAARKGLPWSLSDTVCTLKAVARRAAERPDTDPPTDTVSDAPAPTPRSEIVREADEPPFWITELEPRFRDGIENWIRYARLPGGFLTAVLEDSLYRALHAADRRALKQIPIIVRYLQLEAPHACWGSPEKVRAWQGDPEWREGSL